MSLKKIIFELVLSFFPHVGIKIDVGFQLATLLEGQHTDTFIRRIPNDRYSIRFR